MLICGIHDGHNASAALVRDGRLVAALQEERPRRVKNWHGFPSMAIRALLASAGASPGDVDTYVFSGDEYYDPPGRGPGDREAQVHAYKANVGLGAEARRRLRETPARAVVQAVRKRRRIAPLLERGVKLSAITTVRHHLCHASTAYFGPGAERDVLVMTLDGAGDGMCATVSAPDDNGRLALLDSVKEEHSVGILWALVTSLLGMVPNEHEYKMMGMAPYATGRRARGVAEKFASAFVLRGGTWTRSAGAPPPNYAYAYWRDRLEFDRFDDVCGGLQMFTEEIICAWVRHWVEKTGRRKLRLSGGVFMNVKLNKAIGEIPGVEDLWVFPSCGDETNAVGAAWAHLDKLGARESIEPLGPFYLGIAPDDADYETAAAAARKKGYDVRRPADLEDEVAELLRSGEVVARFAGREEFGARALGNRSILADPSRRDTVTLINRAIKCRDFWMPFAPSVMKEAADRYVHNPKGFRAPYMILAFDSRHTDEVVAACHPEDKTIRPQIVEHAWNPGYHRLIERFSEKTGRGILLNTSFNLHGEPIVSRPIEGVDILERSGLGVLALGPFLIRRPGGTTPSATFE